MKGFALLITLQLFGTLLSFGQELKVVSEETKTPVAKASVEINCTGSDKVVALVTNDKGIVTLPQSLQCTEYFVRITHSDFEEFTLTTSSRSNQTLELAPLSDNLKEVVITAQYAPGSAENAVHKIKVIDRSTIDRMGAQNLRDVLTNTMNVRLSQDNVLGSSMSLQGVSGQNVKILIDGVAVTGRVNGNIDISQINMNNVERIEIVEGPLSVSYGTDALAGTINIITKKFEKPSCTGSVSTYYESIGQYNFSGRVARSTEKMTFSLLGGRNYFDGWKYEDTPFYMEKELLADSNRVKDWKPKEQYFGTFFAGVKFNKLRLGYTSDYFYEQIMNRGLPRAPYFETAFDDYYTTHRFSNSLTLNGQLTKRLNTNLLFAYNYYQRVKNTYVNDLTTLNQQLTETASDQDTSKFLNFTARGTFSTFNNAAKLNGEIGYDLQHETGLGLRIKDNKQQIGDYAVFGSIEYRPTENLVIRPGLRVMYNTSYKAPLVPSINIKQNIGKRHSIRASYARGFRAPSLKDLYFYFVDVNHNIRGNEDLKAEYSHNFTLAYNNRFNIGKTAWKFENSYFYNNIENLITLAQASATEYTYFNLSRFKTLGTQVQFEMNWNRLTASIGGSYVGRYNELSETYDSEPFMYSPEGRLNAQYLLKGDFTASVFYKYTGETPNISIDENGAMYKSVIADYNTLDCSFSKGFYRRRIVLTIGAKNLFNVRNIVGTATSSAHAGSSSTIPMAMGRTYFFKLDINLTTKP